jgi:high-affinity iron transporter
LTNPPSLPQANLASHQFYTKLTDLWANTEQIWEGVFSLIACVIIYLMGIAFLKMDRSRVKWRLKLASSFEQSHSQAIAHHAGEDGMLVGDKDQKDARSGKWALFLLPFVTVLREGLEAVVFVGGVSPPSFVIGHPADSFRSRSMLARLPFLYQLL